MVRVARQHTPKYKRGRRRVAQVPGSPLAWPCVVVGVDTANRSGYAVRVAGRLVESGEIQTDRDRVVIRRVIADAVERARRLDCREPLTLDFRVVLVLEKAWGGDTRTVLGLGAARERWVDAWVRMGQPLQRIVDVYPSTWRARVLGIGSVRVPRDVVRATEMHVALAEMAKLGVDELGPDEAAAILIARWGARAGEVGKVLESKKSNGKAERAKRER
jgi:hypothetical protein